MRSQTCLAAALLLAACGGATDRAAAPARLPEAARHADTVGLVAPASPVPMPALALRPFRGPEGVLDSIQVLRGDHRTQTLIPRAGADAPVVPGTDVDTVDINLDGFPDVQQQVAWGATGNAAYSFWLFDPSSGRFEDAPEFSRQIMGYTLDRARREIVVRSNGGHAGAIFELDVYRPTGRALTRVRSVHQDWLPAIERYVRTTGRLDAGAWVERADTFTAETLPSPDSIEG